MDKLRPAHSPHDQITMSHDETELFLLQMQSRSDSHPQSNTTGMDKMTMVDSSEDFFTNPLCYSALQFTLVIS